MSSSSKSGAGAEAVATTENKVDPGVAMCVKVSLGAFAVLFYIASVALAVRFCILNGGPWWDSWMAVLMLTAQLVWLLWSIPKMFPPNVHRQGSDDDANLSAELLAPDHK
ncbi:hypothetical protein BS78_01G509400 [Paspalum vaginatum]|nr:hypothetical protein BS78_01G509400 [Paspalum vaginatum]